MQGVWVIIDGFRSTGVRAFTSAAMIATGLLAAGV